MKIFYFSHFEILTLYFRNEAGMDHTCLECDKTFSSKKSLDEHTSTVHATNKPFSCDVCSKTYATDIQFRRHRKLHTMDRMFSCEKCGNSFKQKSYLVRHMDTHNENPYICGTCGNSFRRKDGLQQHKRLHNHRDQASSSNHELSLLSCGVCQVVFTDTDTLDMHKLSHTNNKEIKEEGILVCELKVEPNQESLL